MDRSIIAIVHPPTALALATVRGRLWLDGPLGWPSLAALVFLQGVWLFEVQVPGFPGGSGELGGLTGARPPGSMPTCQGGYLEG